MEPAVANGNTSSSVILELFCSWIKAAVFHAFPNIVDFRSFFAVLKSTFIANLAARTATFQFWDFAGDFLYSAVAANPPTVFYTRFWCWLQHDQSPKTQSGDISEFRHDGLPERRLCLRAARFFAGYGPPCHLSTARVV
jgi:hypothetical protein